MYDWKKSLLNPQDTMRKVIETLDQEALRIALVVDDNGCLLGTITDGDIRRALLRQAEPETTAIKIMHSPPITASIGQSQAAILAKMKTHGVLQMPIVDDHNHVVGLETLQHIIDGIRYDNPVFLMAGGFGKRLRPLTNDIPKPLLKVGDKPILEKILEHAIDSGFHNFFISTHYKAEMLREYFGSGERWGVSIHYVHEDKPLGTAGALGLLPDDIPKLPILTMNGDLLTNANLASLMTFHDEQGGIATMCVREYDFQVPYGVIETDGSQVTSIIEKPVHHFFVNAGIYSLSYQFVTEVRGRGRIDMPQLLHEHICNGHQVNMFPLHEYWLDIGRMEEYEHANRNAKG